jgi:predicted porin
LDVIPEVTIGAFGITGTWDENDIERDFSRYGIDLQAEYSNIRLTGAFLHAKDDRQMSGSEENDAWYTQAFYVLRKDTRPLLVPLVRFDSYEENDGKDGYDELTLNVGYYFTENIKGYVEYCTQTDKPDDVMRDNRITLQIVAAF